MTAVRPTPAPLERPIRLGVLISGGGTTLDNLVRKIEQRDLDAEVAIVVANRSNCGGIEKSRRFGFPSHVVSRKECGSIDEFSDRVFSALRSANVDLVLLAGFLSFIQIPDDFQFRVLNIHPALIPAFSGQGFYGHHVHEAVISRGVKISGCTVHFADNEYDHGPIILQRTVPVLDGDSPANLAARVFESECEAYPEAVRQFASGRLEVEGGRVMLRDRP
ncbi:MAG: phosphoribosylglycinamide formyltransferase [Planctomycetota bacterium]|nr:phosphoribosylglycinamide formyltransferase [Planctomycetota bacterium]